MKFRFLMMIFLYFITIPKTLPFKLNEYLYHSFDHNSTINENFKEISLANNSNTKFVLPIELGNDS